MINDVEHLSICLLVICISFFTMCLLKSSVSSTFISMFLIFFLNYFLNLFLAKLGLCCCMWAFSSCGEWGLLSSCGVQTSHCCGFSWGPRAPGFVGSVVVLHWLSCPEACGKSLFHRKNFDEVQLINVFLLRIML